MKRNQFSDFSDDLQKLGSTGIAAPEFCLGRSGTYHLQYTPFEHLNRDAKLVIVGITPGNTQLELAYAKAQALLKAGRPEEEILFEIKKVGAFGGPSMKPNLLKMLRHFRFDNLLEIDDVESLWGANASLLHSTSVVPHAAFKAGERFAGGFDEVLASPLLKECFLDCFVPSVREINPEALFIGLGPCPQAALEWCVQNGHLSRRQVLGAFCHPSSAGGSTTRYYLREVSREALDPKNPVRGRCDWLDQAYEQMQAATSSLLGSDSPISTSRTPVFVPIVTKSPPDPIEVPAPPKREIPVARSTSTPATGDIATIVTEFERAGYLVTNSTTKVAEFRSPGGQTIYLVKKTSRLNRINLMVHPGLKRDVVDSLAGPETVCDEYRFHSNMTRFPKRLNTGKTETAYGWQISLDTLGRLPHFLSAFRTVTL